MREAIEEVVTTRTSATRSRAIRFGAAAVIGMLYTAALNLPVVQIDITPDDSGPETLITKPVALDFTGTDALRGGWEGVGLYRS